jgi:hypothetical protein
MASKTSQVGSDPPARASASSKARPIPLATWLICNPIGGQTACWPPGSPATPEPYREIESFDY